MLVYFMTVWHILQPFGTFYGHLVHFTAILYMYLTDNWYIFKEFVTFNTALVCSTKKNLATLVRTLTLVLVVAVGDLTEKSLAVEMDRQSNAPDFGPGVNFMKQLRLKFRDKN
jgi:hypothetical protein